MPTISVIVPVYKAEKYIHRCVDSILSQTFQDFELILVDDGSPDNCPAICDEYAAKDSRIRVLHQENQGQAAARNHGVAIAHCDWICFVDSDDLIHPQMVEYLFKAVVRHNAKIGMCSALEAEHLPTTFSLPKTYSSCKMQINEQTLSNLYRHGRHRPWVIWGKIIHKDIILHTPLTAGRVFEDNAVAVQWLYTANTVADIDEELYFYRTTPVSTVRGSFTLKKLDYLWALEHIASFFKKVKYTDLRKYVCREYIHWVIEYYKITHDEQSNKKSSALIRRRLWLFLFIHNEYITLTDGQSKYIRYLLFPNISQICNYLHIAKTTIAKDGIAALVQRIRNHFMER